MYNIDDRNNVTKRQNMVPDTYQCSSIMILSALLNTYQLIFLKPNDILTKKLIT